MLRKLFVLFFAFLLSLGAHAQFTGPETATRAVRVSDISAARLGSYVNVTGHILTHLRENYYTFSDGSGEIRVEIDSSVWGGRKVGPQDKIRLVGEVGRGWFGRYLWVTSLEPIP